MDEPSAPASFPDRLPDRPRKGRGALGNPDGRFETLARERVDDGWMNLESHGEEPEARPTIVLVDTSKHVITRNDSPDVPFTLSINPYRGCEHGCCYCFARPSHSFLGLSPGLDFETKIAHKPDAAQILLRELAAPSYRCSPIALGINTDAYQPLERKLRLTRSLLQVLHDCHHPVSIVTKSTLIERDLDLLAAMARENLVQVIFSVTTLDTELARRMEPRAASPMRRLDAMRTLAAAGVPVGVLFAPLIPALNDHEMEAVLKAARDAAADSAGYVLLRLPHELKDMFRHWLAHHAPGKAKHVMSLMRDLHGGRDYDARFGTRMRGSGVFADLIAQRFRIACERLGLNAQRRRELDCSRFQPPTPATPQLSLF